MVVFFLVSGTVIFNKNIWDIIMTYSKNKITSFFLKGMFALFTILPLLLFILMSNEGLPRLLDFSHIWGIPTSILVLLILMIFQVMLAWFYSLLFTELKEDKL